MPTGNHDAYHPHAHTPDLPTFVSHRIARFVDDRFNQLWGGRHLLHGSPPPPDALMLSSNDYLRLTQNPAWLATQTAGHEANQQLLMSPVFHDEHSPTRQLETRLAHYAQTPDGILCQSGWAANTGMLQAIANENTPVYLDQLAHMSLWYGARAAGAPVVVFRHNDAEHLSGQLARHGPGIITVDAIYSTNGSLCQLPHIADACAQSGCVLVVDESHSLGVFGHKGAGLVSELGLHGQVHFITASLAKAFAWRAGFIGCPKGFKDYFMMASYPTCFSSVLLDLDLACIGQALSLIECADDQRRRLGQATLAVRQALKDAKVPVSPGSQQIVALEGGSEARTMALRDALEQRGVFGSVFCAPATAVRHALVRLSLHSELDEQQVQRLIEGCISASRNL
nr:alpha-hydroxyketone-type quorum-sensing autoinducer synthase [Pseudomonas fakonensis]